MINKPHNTWMDYILERLDLPMKTLQGLRRALATQSFQRILAF